MGEILDFNSFLCRSAEAQQSQLCNTLQWQEEAAKAGYAVVLYKTYDLLLKMNVMRLYSIFSI